MNEYCLCRWIQNGGFSLQRFQFCFVLFTALNEENIWFGVLEPITSVFFYKVGLQTDSPLSPWGFVNKIVLQDVVTNMPWSFYSTADEVGSI